MEVRKSAIIGFVLFSVIVIIGLIVLLATGNLQFSSPTGKVVENSQENKKNCRDVQVPYEEQEEYTDTVPYEEETPLKYTLTNKVTKSCSDFGNYKECYYVSIMNLDTIGGIFIVDCTTETLNRKLTSQSSSYIKAGDTQTLICTADVDWGEDTKWSYEVNPPTKTETRYKDVTRTRKITQYKTETKCD